MVREREEREEWVGGLVGHLGLSLSLFLFYLVERRWRTLDVFVTSQSSWELGQTFGDTFRWLIYSERAFCVHRTPSHIIFWGGLSQKILNWIQV